MESDTYRMYTTQQTLSWLWGLQLLIAASPLCADEATNQYALAADHYSHRRWELAAEEFKVFLDQSPNHQQAPHAAFYLGESLLQLKQYDAARVHYQHVVDDWPASTFARQSRFRAAEMLFLAGKYDEARHELEIFDQDRESDKLNAYALAYRGQIANNAGVPDVAEAIYRDAIQRFPDGPLKSEVRYGLARALELQGNHDEALRFYQFLAEHSHSSLRDDAHLRAAILLYQQHRYADALELLARFQTDLAASPLGDEAKFWTGMCQLKSGATAEAAETFAHAEHLPQDHRLAPAFAFRRAEAVAAAGDAAVARTCYDKVHTTWPDSDWADDALYACCTLAFAGNDDEQLSRLASRFQQHHSSSPLAPRVAQLAGRLALRQQRYDDAITIFASLTAVNQPALTPSSVPTAATVEAHVEPAPADAAQATGESHTRPAESAWEIGNRYYLGVAYLGAERPHEALAALAEVATADDGAGELCDNIRVATATARMALKQYAEAVTPLAEYLASQPQCDDAAACRAKLALCYLELDDLESLRTAIDQYRQHDAATESFLTTIAYLADQSVAKGHHEIGRELYTLLTDDGTPAEFLAKGLAGLGRLQWASGDTAGSATTFARLLASAAGSDEAPAAGLMRARSLEQGRQFDDALAAFRVVFEDYAAAPEATVAKFEAAKLHDRLGQDHKAHELLLQLVAQTPRVEPLDAVLYQLAWVQSDLGLAAEATTTFEQLVRDHPTSEYHADAMYRLAERAFQTGDLPTAESYVGRLLATPLAPRLRCHALYLDGQLAAQQQRWADVVLPMTQLVNDFPDHALQLPARYWLAEAAYRTGDYTAAIEQFSRLAEDVRGDDASWAPMVPLRRAQCLAHQEQWSEALATAQGIYESFPNFRQLYEADYVIGRCLSTQARFSEAREAFTRVVRSTTGGRTETAAMAQWMMGESFLHQQDYREAVRAYHRVVSLHAYPQWQAAALLQAGKCQEQLGQWREAVNLYSQLLRDFPDTSYASDAGERLRTAQQSAATSTN